MEKYAQLVKQNVNLPNMLSSFRILIIVPLIYFFLQDNYVIAGAMLLISGVSDMFDGFFARKFNQVTKLGAMLDPVADKLTLAAVIVCIGVKFTEATPLVAILIFKELAMLVASVFLLNHRKEPTSAKWYGKLATVVFYISVIILVSLKAVWNFESTAVTIALMSITVFFMLFAFIKYLFLFIDQIKNIKGENKDVSMSDVKEH